MSKNNLPVNNNLNGVIEVINYATESFLGGQFWEKNIQDVIKKLGKILNVSRVYIFKKIDGEEKVVQQLYEWADKDIKPQINSKELQFFSMEKGGLNRWLKSFLEKKPIYGLVTDFPKSEQNILISQDIKSLLCVPVFVKDDWWGFIGFDECKENRIWALEEISILSATANIIGSAINQSKIIQEFIATNKELSKFNHLMVGRELKMMELKEKIAKNNS